MRDTSHSTYSNFEKIQLEFLDHISKYYNITGDMTPEKFIDTFIQSLSNTLYDMY